MTCKICDWLQSWLGARVEIDCNRIWDNIHDWESAHSNDGELWAPEADRNRELFDQASAIQDSDPESAFHMYMRAAVAGSPWAMRTVAWHYHWGSFVSVDHALAQDYYHRAICAGSWMATLPYARLLADEGRFEDAETVLKTGSDPISFPHTSGSRGSASNGREAAGHAGRSDRCSNIPPTEDIPARSAFSPP